MILIVSLHFFFAFEIQKRVLSLPLDHPHRPKEINTAYGNDEVKDILFMLGIRFVAPYLSFEFNVSVDLLSTKDRMSFYLLFCFGVFIVSRLCANANAQY